MHLTKKEQLICDKYSAYYPAQIMIGGEMITVNKVRCPECPLVIDRNANLCRKNATREDLMNYV